MFEVGMSALVLKICSEYAKSLGLNFPPCTQQEINAICEWVDKHTIKDMTISQDGFNVTFTFKTENDVTKEFTFAIPKAVDIDELEKVLVGSESVVVERLEDNSGLKVRIAQSVLNDINNKLAKPANPASDSVVTMAANGSVGTKPLSEIGGKLYLHKINLKTNAPEGFIIMFSIILNTSTLLTYDRLVEIAKFVSCIIMSTDGTTTAIGNIMGFYYSNNVFTASIVYNDTTVEYGAQLLGSPQDTVIEL